MTEQLLQVAFTALLARMVTRADVGIVTMALIFNRFAVYMTSMGWGTAVIQAKAISNKQISGLFSLHVFTAFIVSLICCLSAPAAAYFYRNAAVIPIIQVLAWSIFLDSLSFPVYLMQKAHCYRPYAMLRVVSMVAGNLAGVWLAATGYGVWALVWRNIGTALITAIVIWPIAGWRPVAPTFRDSGALLRFGANRWAANVLTFFSQNTAGLIAGRMLGAEALGAFSIAYNIALVPAQKMKSTLGTVLIPSFSSLSFDKQKLQNGVYTALFLVSLVYVPAMLGLSAVAMNLVTVVYTDKWHDAGLLLSILAWVGLVAGMENMLQALLLAAGGVSAMTRIAVIEALVALPLMAVSGKYFGSVGLAYAYVLASYVPFVLSKREAEKVLDLRGIFSQAVNRTMTVGIAMFIGSWAVGFFLMLTPFAELTLQVIVGGLIYLTLRFMFLNAVERSQLESAPYLGTGYRFFLPFLSNEKKRRAVGLS
jgi:O-antigen/teichoic acid export membrane protein